MLSCHIFAAKNRKKLIKIVIYVYNLKNVNKKCYACYKIDMVDRLFRQNPNISNKKKYFCPNWLAGSIGDVYD